MNSIRFKILGAFLLIIILLGIMSIYSLHRLRTIGDKLFVINAGYIPLTKMIAELETYQLRQFGKEIDINKLADPDEREYRNFYARLANDVFPRLVQKKINDGKLQAYRTARFVKKPAEIEALNKFIQYLDSVGRKYEDYYRTIGDLMGYVKLKDFNKAAEVIKSLNSKKLALETELILASRSIDRRIHMEVLYAEQQEQQARVTIITLSILVIGIATLVTIFAQFILRPIRRLIDATRRISSGDYSQRINITSGDEIGQLAGEFDKMANSLEERDQELEKKQQALIQAERLATIGKISAQITHELRNPLNSISLNLELLGDEIKKYEGLPEGQRSEEAWALINSINREIERLTEVTADYLRFARLPEPKLELASANRICRDILSFLQKEIMEKNIGIESILEEELPPVMIDSNQIRQALMNLIRNSLESITENHSSRLGKEPPNIRVSTRSTDGGIQIEVQDNGEGIIRENLRKIFDPFFSTKNGGTGLGLPISQQIIEAHGGTLTCDSEPKVGTTFTITLPLG